MEQQTVMLSRNGTDGRVYGGDCELIHVSDGKRAMAGAKMAEVLDSFMRRFAEDRTDEQKQQQLLCPGCYMVVCFNMLLDLAKRNNQPLTELCLSMENAFASLRTTGIPNLEEILVVLDPE